MPYSHPQPIDKSQALTQIRHLLPGALALTFIAGFINSVALGFFHAPVSHMTGAVSHLGLDLSRRQWADAAAALAIILGFGTGALLTGLVLGSLHLLPGRRYGVVLICEGLFLGCATGLLIVHHRFGLPLVAMACGLQNAMTSSYCGLMIRTTHVTGTVTDIGVMLGHWLRHRQIDWQKLSFLTSVFLAFGAGGAFGAIADSFLGAASLGIAATACLISGTLFFVLTHRGLVVIAQQGSGTPSNSESLPKR